MSRHTGRILFSEKNTSRSVLDANTNQRPYWVRGDDFELEFALENQDGSFVTAAQVGTIEIVVRAANESESEPKRMTETIGAGACDSGFSAGQWQTGGSLAVATWTAAEAALEVPEGKGSQLYYIYAVHTNGSGYKTTYGAYLIEVRKAPHATPTLTAPDPPEETPLTVTQGDTRYAPKSAETDPLVLVVLGQSLAVSTSGGAAYGDVALNPDIEIWNISTGQFEKWDLSTSSQLPRAIAGGSDPTPGTFNNLGWEAARKISDVTGRKVRVIFNAENGRALSYFNPSTPGVLWTQLESQLDAAEIDHVFGVIWQHGEADTNMDPALYEAAQLEIYSALLARNEFDERTVWSFGEIPSRAGGSNPTRWWQNDVFRGFSTGSRGISNARFTATADLPLASDGIHLTGEGTYKAGIRHGESLLGGVEHQTLRVQERRSAPNHIGPEHVGLSFTHRDASETALRVVALAFEQLRWSVGESVEISREFGAGDVHVIACGQASFLGYVYASVNEGGTARITRISYYDFAVTGDVELWTPLEMSALHSWFDAGYGITRTSLNISAWASRKSGGFSLTGNNSPRYDDDGINGIPAVQMNGTDDTFSSSTIGAALTQPWSVVSASQIADTAGRSFLIVGDYGGLNRPVVGEGFNTWNLNANVELTGPAIDTDTHIYTVVADGGSSKIYDGESLEVTGNASTLGFPTNFELGAHPTAGHFNGVIGDVMIFTDDVSGHADFGKLQAFLRGRYLI